MADLLLTNGRAMREAYLADVRRKRMYGGILLVLFIALMASGFRLAEDRNAGGFLVGIGQILDFPAEVVAEGWAKRAEIPGLLVSFFPSLIETVDSIRPEPFVAPSSMPKAPAMPEAFDHARLDDLRKRS